MTDAIKPNHYKSGSGDVIDFCQHHELNFSRGNVVKYVTRAGKKDPSKELEDLVKAQEYLQREVQKLLDDNHALLNQSIQELSTSVSQYK